MLTYDEPLMVERLSRLDRGRRTAFAAACAQRLQPLYLRYAVAAETADDGIIQQVVGQVWDVLRGADNDLGSLKGAADALVPREAADWILETGYAQNAAACAEYAVRSWLSGEAHEAAWAARQVYEVADYAAQQLVVGLDLNSPDAESRLASHPLVQESLAAIERDLVTVEQAYLDVDELAERASVEGMAWSRRMP